jgi:hypothetical protein
MKALAIAKNMVFQCEKAAKLCRGSVAMAKGQKE